MKITLSNSTVILSRTRGDRIEKQDTEFPKLRTGNCAGSRSNVDSSTDGVRGGS